MHTVVRIGNGAYLIVLLITFPLALLQGASPKAILQLGTSFLVTELITPYVPPMFALGAECPTTSLVIITLVCGCVGHTFTATSSRSGSYTYANRRRTTRFCGRPLMLFIVRTTLPWAAANVSLLAGVIVVRWGQLDSPPPRPQDTNGPLSE